MTSAGWIFIAIGAVIIWLDAYAILRVFTSPFYEPGQRWAQAALILFAPIIGASLALYSSRENVSLFQKPPVDHVKDIDPTCSDIDYHG
ncbi:MAG: hypothetical protein V4447_07580 [Pseudomonadota bacterium]